jgi:hypothetical protein
MKNLLLSILLVLSGSINAKTLVLGDSLHANTLDGSLTIVERLRVRGQDIDCQCVVGMSLMQLGWTLPERYDTVIVALLTNDALFSLTMGDKWWSALDVYLHRLETLFLKHKDKEFILILPTFSSSDIFTARIHLYRWFAGYTASKHGVRIIDMAGRVTVGSDGLHYGDLGAEQYTQVLIEKL